MQPAACGSASRRAYPACRSCGRVAEGGGLLNRYRVVKPYRGFESLRLRQHALCLARTQRWQNVPKRWVTTSCRTGCRGVARFAAPGRLAEITVHEAGEPNIRKALARYFT